VRCFIRFNALRYPKECSGADVERFLGWLAAERRVSVSTHKQALSALLFLYRDVLGVELPWMTNIGRPKSPARLPVVLSRAEIARLLALTQGSIGELARLLYGTGMRLMEALRPRVKDVDFDRRLIVIREGKAGKDRIVMLPDRRHLLRAVSRIAFNSAW
jgi:integrase